MPTLPLPLTMNNVDEATAADDEATTKSGFIIVAFELPTERFAHGDVVPMPTLPPEVAKYAEPVEEIWVVEAFPVTVKRDVALFHKRFAALAIVFTPVA